YAQESVLTLVTEVIPELDRRFHLTVETVRLPEVNDTLKPRLVIEARQQGDELAVFPTLVYGDPPSARIDGHRLVYLGGAIPLRSEAQETRLASRLRRELGLAPGHRAVFTGESATTFAAKL